MGSSGLDEQSVPEATQKSVYRRKTKTPDYSGILCQKATYEAF
jgi:hypothetical protein